VKHMLNTLFVTTQGAYLAKEGDTVTVKVEGQTKLRLPLHGLDGIVCFGQVSCSPWLMGACAERGILISFMTENGRFQARVCGPVSGNVLLRRAQYRRADEDEFPAGLARSIVIAKIANCRTVLMRAIRDRPDRDHVTELEGAVKRLARSLRNLEGEQSLDAVRGIEGEAARSYFGVFDHLVAAQKDDFCFRERSRRSPMDTMNALLSFLYTLLTHDMTAALEAVGLDPAVGYLHRDRPGRPGLALDLIEELRPFLADRLALSLVNRQQVKGSGFRQSETGAVMMDDETRKRLLVAYQKRKREEIRHPFLGEKTQVGLLPHLQATLLARCLRGDLDGYPPFVWK